jgi:hypothetical protein
MLFYAAVCLGGQETVEPFRSEKRLKGVLSLSPENW